MSLCNQFTNLHWACSVHLEISVSPDSVHLRMMLPTVRIILFLAVFTLVVGSSKSEFLIYFHKESGPYFSRTGHKRCFSHYFIVMLVRKTKDLSLASLVCPPPFVHYTIVTCVSRDWFATHLYQNAGSPLVCGGVSPIYAVTATFP